MILADYEIERLMQIEASIHYSELPPPNREPFVVINRQSPIIISAPHGAITFRNNAKEKWHEEDEYTAGMALLISQKCNTSVIATIWRTEESDPNEYPFEQSLYKQEMRQLIEQTKGRWIIDLHGASAKNENLAEKQWVDLGLGNKQDYLPDEVKQKFVAIIEQYLGEGVIDRKGKKGIQASDPNRIAAFVHTIPLVSSVQIEMKPLVRIPSRRIDASMFARPLSSGGGPYSAPSQNVLGMMQALVDFIEYLKSK
jgi:hypothetical protein